MTSTLKASEVDFRLELSAEYVELEPMTARLAYDSFVLASAFIEHAAQQNGAQWTTERLAKPAPALGNSLKHRDDGRARYTGVIDGLLAHIGVLVSTVAAAVPIVTAIRPMIIEFLHNRGLKRITVTVGTTKLEVRGEHDVDEVMKLIASISNSQSPATKGRGPNRRNKIALKGQTGAGARARHSKHTSSPRD